VADQAAAILSDRDGEIVSWNCAAEALLGHSAAGTVGIFHKTGDVIRVTFEVTLLAAEGGGAVEGVLIMLEPSVSTQEDVAH
jgi:hypothetical protein